MTQRQVRPGCASRNIGGPTLFRSPLSSEAPDSIPQIVHEVLRSSGEPLDTESRAFFEPRFGRDLSAVRVHADDRSARSARAVNSLAYAVGQEVVFGAGQFNPKSSSGKRLLAHELAHVVQAGPVALGEPAHRIAPNESPQELQAESAATRLMAAQYPTLTQGAQRVLCRQPAPFIKQVTVHLTPKQSADLQWEGSPPDTAPGQDHFTVSTGKGYDDPGDPAGTCTRHCCKDAKTQCAPPFNQPGHVGACCTYFGSDFWTGTPEDVHDGGWKFWTPIQPFYSQRAIALHQHPEVTGDPIGHGCVRMEEKNAERIAKFSRGRKTKVVIDGRASPVACADDRKCPERPGKRASVDPEATPDETAEELAAAIPGLEGQMS